MTTRKRASYTFEFKEEAVRLVSGGKKVAVVAHELGISEQTRHNWVKALSAMTLTKRDASAVSSEQMEINRPRSAVFLHENGARHPKKAAVYPAKESP